MMFKSLKIKICISIPFFILIYICLRHWKKGKHLPQQMASEGSHLLRDDSDNYFDSTSKNIQSSLGVIESTGLTALTIKKNKTSSHKRFKNVSNVKVESVDCNALFRGDSFELMQAERYHATFNYSEAQQKVQLLEIRDLFSKEKCKSYLLDRGYAMRPSCKEEKEFPIAYSILIYKDFQQFERLLRAVYRPQNFYCVHVDVKADPLYKQAVKSLVDCFPGGKVFISPVERDVKWGTFTVLEPELDCMKELWERFAVEMVDKSQEEDKSSNVTAKKPAKKPRWKYFINLTGQEFPLRTNLELVRILKAFNGSNNLEATRERMYEGVVKYYKENPPPNNLVIWKGSVHVVISREFVDFVLHHHVSKELLDFLRPSYVPDEYFFSTLNNNPKFGVPGSYTGSNPETDTVNNRFIVRFKNWGVYPFAWPCKGRWVRQICQFGVGDLPLLASRDELFANKFDYSFEPLAYDCMEELFFNKTREEYDRYYRQHSVVIEQNSVEGKDEEIANVKESKNGFLMAKPRLPLNSTSSGINNPSTANRKNGQKSSFNQNQDHLLFPKIDFTSFGDKEDGGFIDGPRAIKLYNYLKWIRPQIHKPGRVDFEHYKEFDFIKNHFHVPEDWVYGGATTLMPLKAISSPHNSQ